MYSSIKFKKVDESEVTATVDFIVLLASFVAQYDYPGFPPRA